MKDKKKLIGSALVAVAILIVIFICRGVNKPQKQINENENEIFTESSLVQSKEVKDTTVYINGEVKNPGVYRLKDGSIMDDLIKAAGGLTENADMDRLKVELNLAQKLRDGDHIYVNSKNDAAAAPLNTSISSGQNGGKININRASLEELKTIPGIGDVTAKNIINYREKHGGFSSIEEIKNIERIGDKTFEKLKDKLDVR